MRADAGFHPDPTRRQIGESGLHLATRPLLPQHDGTALILANDVERVLADIDADYGGRSVEFMFFAVSRFLRKSKSVISNSSRPSSCRAMRNSSATRRNSGKNPSWTSYEKIREVIEKRIFSQVEDLLPVISFGSKKDGETEKKHGEFVARMVERGYTERQVRRLVEWYMRVKQAG